jgi:hypothetical protein
MSECHEANPVTFLNREAILGRAKEVGDLPREEMAVPEWGGSVYVRGLTGAEFDSILSKKDKSGNLDENGLAARIVVLGVCDAEGKRVFAPNDIAPLTNRQLHGVLVRVSNRIKKLSGIGENAEENAEKN